MPSIISFLFGILAASFALLSELFLASFSSAPVILENTFSFSVFLIILGIAFIEEASKYVFLRQYARRFLLQARTPLKNSVLPGALFGLGFASLEMIFAVNAFTLVPSLPLLGTAGLHMATSIAFAMFLCSSAAPLRSSLIGAQRRFLTAYLITTAVLLHTLYNMYILILS